MFRPIVAAKLLVTAAALVLMPGTGPEAAGPRKPITRSAPEEKVDPAALYREGLERLEAGDYRAARDRFEAVLDAAPDNADAHYGLGLAQIGRGRLRAAGRAFEAALERRADFIEAIGKLGEVAAERGKTQDAEARIAALEEILLACGVTCPEGLEDRIGVAVSGIRAVLDGRRKASPQRDAGLEGGTAAGEAAYARAVGLINGDAFASALPVLDRAARLIGPHPDVLTYEGFANRKLGRYDVAEKLYAQALALDPAHKGAHEYLGELYLETNRPDRAAGQLAVLDRLCPFGCAEREELARRIAGRAEARHADGRP